MMSDNFVDIFSKTLNNSSIDSEDGMDYYHLFAVDRNIHAEDILEDPTLNNIPVFNELLSAADTATKVINWNLLNQTAAFFQEFYKGGELSDKAKKHLNVILSNEEKIQNELGRVLILLNRNIDEIKSKYDAKYLKEYLNYRLSTDEFFELLDITDRMFVEDFDLLYNVFKSEGIKEADITYRHDRLISFGLLVGPYDHRGAVVRGGEDDILLEITSIGRSMCEIIF